jgi:ABC-type antimicrobial peptide transport system permease subunit
MGILTGFAALALVLAALGIYAVLTCTVGERRAELAIRMALGADRRTVVGMVVRQSMTATVIGLSAGLAIALTLGRAIQGLLFDVRPADPVTLLGVVATLLATALAASWLPGRAASRVNPMEALRSE